MNPPKPTEKAPRAKPVIRQTKASLYRLARNNPMLVHGNTLENVVIPETVTSLKKKERFRKPIEIAPVVPAPNSVLNSQRKNDGNDNKKRLLNNEQKSVLSNQQGSVISNQQRSVLNNQQRSVLSNQQISYRSNKPVVKSLFNNREISKNGIVVNNQNNHQFKASFITNKKAPLKVNAKCIPNQKPRRSLSAQHFESKKHLPVLDSEKEVINAELTQSMENIVDVSNISPIKKKSVKFQSPWNVQQQHISRRSILHSTPMVTKGDLQSRLNDWLRKRGKSLSTFHHLKCFGLHKAVRKEKQIKENDENKENIEEVVNLAKSKSYEALHIVGNVDRVEEKLQEVVEPHKLKGLAIDALEDLNKLIVEGYPIDQCEAWVARIRFKYSDIEEEPQYWECRAAIERSKGNINSAVNCLTTAITKGAEVQHVDESLEQLFKKFSKLDINTSTQDTLVDCQMKGLTEMCNIFKSTLIQFAVQDRARSKQKDEPTASKQYIATPVRRSSRLSRSVYVSTPRIKICDSLKDLDESIKEGLSFKRNQYIQ